MRSTTALILGARSDIAMAVAHRFAKEGFDIQLAAREVQSLAADKSDIELRYHVEVSLHEFDALDVLFHERFLDALPQLPTVAVCAVGHLGNQADDERDVQTAVLVSRSNFEGPASILAALANRFENRGSGCLVGISSVAGERGRAANYVYGSAKAGFTAFLSGLRNRLAKRGVHVLTVVPGFVDTKMTRGMNLPSWLTAEPDELANIIYKAVIRRTNKVYHRPIWALIMIVIRIIPETVFKTMRI